MRVREKEEKENDSLLLLFIIIIIIIIIIMIDAGFLMRDSYACMRACMYAWSAPPTDSLP